MTRILSRRPVWLAVLLSVAACGGGGSEGEVSGDLADTVPAARPDTEAAPSDTAAVPQPTTAAVSPAPTEQPPLSTTTTTTLLELAPGELLELMSLESPAEGLFPSGIHSFDRLTVLQFNLRGPVFVVEWFTPTAPTEFTEVVLSKVTECADPDGTQCGNSVAGFDPDGCLLVHDALGKLQCYDISDPTNPVDQWQPPIELCEGGMTEMVEYSKVCDAGPVVEAEGLRVMLQPAGRLTVFTGDGELVCQQPSTDFRYSLHEIPLDHAAYEEGHVLLARKQIHNDGTDVVRYDLNTCKSTFYDRELPALSPAGDSTIKTMDENGDEATWTLSSDRDYQVTVSGPNQVLLPLGPVAPWDRPKLITNGSLVYAVLKDTDNKTTIHRLDSGEDEVMEKLPPEINDAAFNGLGQLVVTEQGGGVRLYKIG